MSKIVKFKNKKQNIKICTNCFRSEHIIFSFAYLTYKKDFDDYAKKTLVDRMIELSSIPYNAIASLKKDKGFEEVELKINKEIPHKFVDEIGKFNSKFTVIRLYKNNEPTPGRLIGKLVNKVFYIFYIDVKGELYKH